MNPNDQAQAALQQVAVATAPSAPPVPPAPQPAQVGLPAPQAAAPQQAPVQAQIPVFPTLDIVTPQQTQEAAAALQLAGANFAHGAITQLTTKQVIKTSVASGAGFTLGTLAVAAPAAGIVAGAYWLFNAIFSAPPEL